MDINDHAESDDTNGDGEGVWSPDIEQCFREALLLFPPCGRRKHILQEEGGGKMYGRNELIARHIMMRTGKSRTRKQVSSHIQVLARRKAKAEAASSTSSISPLPSGLRTHAHSVSSVSLNETDTSIQHSGGYYDVWTDRPIVSQKIRLVEFSAFIEYRNFQPISSVVPVGVGANPTLQQTSAPALPSAGALQTTDTDLANVQASNPHQVHQHMQQPPYSNNNNTSNNNNSYINTQHNQSQITHPLASNHHLPAQFNQAGYGQVNNHNNQLQPHIHQKSLTAPGQTGHCLVVNSHVQQPQSSAGFTRHSYVKVDYQQTLGRDTSKLERIDISQLQDKFPEIGGSDGLFQRGPSDAFFLVKFWADLNDDYEYSIDDQNSYFGFSSHFETVDPYKDITCSTKACSYGHQVVEKVEKINGAFNSTNGRYSYHISRSPMCEFMIQFIRKLRKLPRASQMNSVLENFTVLQVITSESTSEILLCLAYVFEVASSDQNNGPQYHVYKLTKD